MSGTYPATLLATRRVLRLLIGLNFLLAFLIGVLLVSSIVAQEFVMKALGVPPGTSTGGTIFGMRLIMVIGIVSAPLTNIVLTRLLAIVDTVKAGDAFMAENAVRLRKIACAALVLEVMHLVVGAVAAGAVPGGKRIGISWSFSFTPWLAVLLLFVLARVFEQGARMREDLAGTI
ncbi:MAG: DUF2975 domain-containing protein [bacterium]